MPTGYRTIPRTAMDVFKLLPVGTTCEVIGNDIYMLPFPPIKHQIVLARLLLKIGNQVQQKR